MKKLILLFTLAASAAMAQTATMAHGIDTGSCVAQAFTSGGTSTLIFTATNCATITASGGNTTLAVSGLHGAGPYFIQIANDATARVWTLPASSPKLLYACLPSAASKQTWQRFTYNGTDLVGSACNNNYAPGTNAASWNNWNQAGQTLYCEGASDTAGLGLGSQLTTGGFAGNFCQLVAGSLFGTAVGSYYNDGVSGETSTTIVGNYTTGTTQTGNVVPSYHSISPGQTGSTARSIYMYVLDPIKNDNGGSISAATSISNVGKNTSSAMTDGAFVIVVINPINTTNTGASIQYDTVFNAAFAGIQAAGATPACTTACTAIPSNMVIDGRRWIPYNPVNALFWQTGNPGHPTALGHLAIANNIVAMLGGIGGTSTYSAQDASEGTLVFTTGPLAAISSTPFGFTQVEQTSTVDTMVVSAMSFTCSGNPVIYLFECGTSATCASSPGTIGTVTLTAAGTATPVTLSSPWIAAGDYVAAEITSGTCTALNLTITAQMHTN